MKRSRHLLQTLLVVIAVLFVLTAWALYQERRQERLNRALGAALKAENVSMALELIQVGGDPNARIEPPPTVSLLQRIKQLLHLALQPPNDSPTAFMFACGSGASTLSSNESHTLYCDASLVTAMLQHGADVNAESRFGRSALEGAIFWNYPQIVELLLKHHAKINQHRSLLLEPIFDTHPILLHLLLNYGAQINAKDDDGKTALMAAALIEDDEIVSLLLQHGADVSLQDQQGYTALHWALDQKADPNIFIPRDVNLNVVRELLERGADPNLPDKRGVTALMLAHKLHHPDLMALLRHQRK